MSAWRTLLHRLGYLPRQRRFDRQLEAELQFHIESRADELEQQGYARDRRPSARYRRIRLAHARRRRHPRRLAVPLARGSGRRRAATPFARFAAARRLP